MNLTDKPTFIIAGSRDMGDPYFHVESMMSQLSAGGKTRGQYEIVTGGSGNVDRAGKKWAEEHDCVYVQFDAKWDEYGKAAGPIRNEKMAEYVGSDGTLVAIWDGESRGTKNMIDTALEYGLDVHVKQVITDE